jgi:hypothetical protein
MPGLGVRPRIEKVISPTLNDHRVNARSWKHERTAGGWKLFEQSDDAFHCFTAAWIPNGVASCDKSSGKESNASQGTVVKFISIPHDRMKN